MPRYKNTSGEWWKKNFFEDNGKNVIIKTFPPINLQKVGTYDILVIDVIQESPCIN